MGSGRLKAKLKLLTCSGGGDTFECVGDSKTASVLHHSARTILLILLPACFSEGEFEEILLNRTEFKESGKLVIELNLVDVERGSLTVVKVGGETIKPVSGRDTVFEFPVDDRIPDGLLTVQVDSTGPSGQVVTRSRDVIIDFRKPEITQFNVSPPLAGANTTLAIQVAASEPMLPYPTVTVAGTRASIKRAVPDSAADPSGANTSAVAAGRPSTQFDFEFVVSPGTALSNGAQPVVVLAKDAAGNEVSKESSVVLDLDPPDTVLDKKPGDPSNVASPVFEFSSTKPGRAFECSLDGVAWSTCTSPHTVVLDAKEMDRTHTFDVRAVDEAGNRDPTPARHEWHVDFVAPGVTITRGPADPSNKAAAEFEFGSTKKAGAFECRLDTGQWMTCPSPYTTSSLVDGAHALEVRAIDAVGNVTADTPAQWKWTVDTAAPPLPKITFGSGLTITNSLSVPLTLTATDAFEMQIAQEEKDLKNWQAFLTPTSWSFSADGNRMLFLKVRDKAQNESPVASNAIKVDTITPKTTIAVKPSDYESSGSALFAFSGSESPVTFTCQLDQGQKTVCTSPVTVSGLQDGVHSYQVWAKDTAANEEVVPAAVSWTVDTVKPVALITAKPSSPSGTSVSFNFTATENVKYFECILDTGLYSQCSSPKTYTNLIAGSHYFSVRAVDLAGNTGASVSHTWTVSP